MKKLIAIIVGVLLPVLPAAAAIAPELWVAGNGIAITNILEAIKGLLNEGSYLQLIEMVGVMAFIFTAVSAAVLQVRPEKVLLFFITFILVFTVSFKATMNVTVHDPVNQYTDVVTDVPLIVAFPSTFISAVGHFFLNAEETFFSYPAGFSDGSSRLSITRSGQFGLLSQMVHDASVIRFQNPHTRASLHAYTEDCVVPKLYTGEWNIVDIRNSTDLWSDLKNTNSAMLTTYYSDVWPQGDIRTCPDAWSRLEDDFASQAPGLIGAAFDSWTMTNATTFFDGAYADAQTWLAGTMGAATTAQLLRKNAVINSFMHTANEVATTYGSSSGLAYAINQAQAEAAQTSGWQIAANIFQRIVGYLYTVVQAFVIAVIPFVLVAFVIPKYGAMLGGTIVKIMIWLALWQPLLGLVNFIIASYLKQGVGGIMASGVTMNNIDALSVASQNASLAASIFATSIPLLSWGLVSGGNFAITQFLAEGAGSIHARQAANQTAAGSASAENLSFRTTRSNDHNLVKTFSLGQANSEWHQSFGINRLQHASGTTSDVAGRQFVNNQTFAGTAQHNQGGGFTATGGMGGASGTRGAYSRATRNALDTMTNALTRSSHSDGQSGSTGYNIGRDHSNSSSIGTSDQADVGVDSTYHSTWSAGVGTNAFNRMLRGTKNNPDAAANRTGGAAMGAIEQGASTSEVAGIIQESAATYGKAGGNQTKMLGSLGSKARALGGMAGGKILTALSVLDGNLGTGHRDSLKYGDSAGVKTTTDAGQALRWGDMTRQQQQASHEVANQFARGFVRGYTELTNNESADTASMQHEFSRSWAATDSYSVVESAGRQISVPSEQNTIYGMLAARSQSTHRFGENASRMRDAQGRAHAKAQGNEDQAQATQAWIDSGQPGITLESAAEHDRNMAAIHQRAISQDGTAPTTPQMVQELNQASGQFDDALHEYNTYMHRGLGDGTKASFLKNSWEQMKIGAQSIISRIGHGGHLPEERMRELNAQYTAAFNLPQIDSDTSRGLAIDSKEVAAKVYDLAKGLHQAQADVVNNIADEAAYNAGSGTIYGPTTGTMDNPDTGIALTTSATVDPSYSNSDYWTEDHQPVQGTPQPTAGGRSFMSDRARH